MVPFFHIVDAASGQAIFVGYFAQRMHGVDIAWLVGLLVAGSVYLALGRSIDLRAEERVIAGIRDSDLASMAQHIAEIEQ